MSSTFWERLERNKGSLTKSGRILSDYLSKHAEEAQYLSISSLAKECGVAEATVCRFCRSLGFRGYHEMRISLAQSSRLPSSSPAPTPPSLDDANSLLAHANTLFVSAVQKTQSDLDPNAVATAARWMREARQVFFMGQGGCMTLAQDIWSWFCTLSTKFHAIADSHFQLLTASLLSPQDVIFFISHSGATRDMMDTLRVARESGAKIILLTHYADSPGAEMADLILLCGEKESPLDSGSISVKVSILYVAQVLALFYSLSAPDDTEQRKQRTTQALSVKLL